ncbi:hypothetical protein [Flavobacterium sp.]
MVKNGFFASFALQIQGNKFWSSIEYSFTFDRLKVKYSFEPVAIPRTTFA